MWNRSKKDDEASSRPATPAPSSSDYGREAIPTSSYAARQGDFSATRAVATIGKSLIIKGLIRGQEDLVIDGRLEGDVDLPENRLTVGVTGHVQGAVRAREIVVLGSIQGNLEASERVEIKKNAKVIGDLKAQRPVIEDEAYFKGNVETIRIDKPAPKPAAPPIVVEPQASLLPDSKPENRKG
ncbi:MAG TPA: polymer-forming cytoskeletal protein [Paludibaculum sp.]|jgi:cytoskeletal protein CcmA (bactofilin family)